MPARLRYRRADHARGRREIASTTAGTGAGGPVDVTARGTLLLDGAGNPNTQIAASATGPQSGPGGNVTVAAGSLTIEGGAEIASSTAGPGSGGDIRVAVSSEAALSGSASDGTPSGITASATASGNAGKVAVSGRTIAISGGAEVSGTTSGTGRGGVVRIIGRDIVLATGGGISVGTTGPGPAGVARVNARRLTVESGAEITGTTAGSGAGGAVDISGRDIVLATGGGVSAGSTGSGSGGTVTVNAESLSVASGAEIASSTAGEGGGGNVSVTAGSAIALSGPGPQITALSTGSGDAGSVIVAVNRLFLSDAASISTEAKTANGGDITLSLGEQIYLTNGQITASVLGLTGNGGDIMIAAPYVILDHSVISASAVGGQNGNITIDEYGGVYIASSDSTVSATGRISINGITPLNGALVVLSSELRSAVALSESSCAARASRPQSSLVAAGRGGLPQGPDGSLPALYIAGRDVRIEPRPAAPRAAAGGEPSPALRVAVRCDVN